MLIIVYLYVIPRETYDKLNAIISKLKAYEVLSEQSINIHGVF